MRCEAVRVLHALREVEALTQALQWLPQKGHSRNLAFQALMDLRESVPALTVADALVHRDDDELLGEQDAQLILDASALPISSWLLSGPEAPRAALPCLVAERP